MACREKDRLTCMGIWGGDPGTNEGRVNKADLIALDWYERNFVGHMLSVFALV